MFDYTKAPKALLVDLINEDNGTSVDGSLLVFSNPAEYVGEKNTTITVTGAAESGYSGSVDFFYNRVPVEGFVGTVELSFFTDGMSTVAELIESVNATLNINLTVDDFVDGPLPEFGSVPNQSLPLNIQTASNSLVYYSSLDVIVSNGEISLLDIVTVTELSGFNVVPEQVID